MNRTLSILFAMMLAIAGSAYAQTDTSATTAGDGLYPNGTTFNGVPVSGLDIGTGALINGTNGVAEGHVAIALFGPTNIITNQQQIIKIEADFTGGSRAAANVVTLNGTATVDMGDGTLPLTGVPIVVTLTFDGVEGGSVGLSIGAASLPTSALTDGTMDVSDIPD